MTDLHDRIRELEDRIRHYETGMLPGDNAVWLEPERDYWRDYWRNRAHQAEARLNALAEIESAAMDLYHAIAGER